MVRRFLINPIESGDLMQIDLNKESAGDSIEKQKEHFESIALLYYEARQSLNSILYKEKLWEHIFGFLPPAGKRGQLTVLEAMCGYAEGEKIVKKHYNLNVQYTGFDYSQNLIDSVKQRYPEKDVFVQDVTKFRPQMQYDLILIIGGLHHVHEFTEDVLNNLKYGLKDSGYLINFEPTHGNRIMQAIRDRIYRKSSFIDYETERDYHVNELNNIYAVSGFDVVWQFSPGLLAYCLYYNPDIFPRLAKINSSVLKILFAIEKPFFRTRIARFFSFATLSVLQRQKVGLPK